MFENGTISLSGPTTDEYVDRLTPESARHEGYEAGVRSVLENTLAHIAALKAPTKQIETLRQKLQDQLDVLDR